MEWSGSRSELSRGCGGASGGSGVEWSNGFMPCMGVGLNDGAIDDAPAANVSSSSSTDSNDKDGGN